MVRSTLLAVAALATGALSQTTTNFTDSASGIDFSYYEKEGWAFGIALPENPTTGGDFIGYLAADTIDGFAAVSLGGPMLVSTLEEEPSCSLPLHRGLSCSGSEELLTEIFSR